MELSLADSKKAQALEALLRGDLEEADRAFRGLWEEYARHDFVEGLVAVGFNRLLTLLERGDHREARTVAAQLTEVISEAPPSALITEVSERLLKLLTEPFPGLDQDSHAGLYSAAEERVGSRPLARKGTISALPLESAMIRLWPEDQLMVCLGAVVAVGPELPLPRWLKAVTRAFPQSSGPDEQILRELSIFTEATQDAGKAYTALVNALERAVDVAPDLAAELAVGLSSLEEKGLPERLRYAAALPEERRLLATIKLHGRLAEALSGVGGAEPLALTQWRQVSSLAAVWLERAQARASRGGRRAEDISREAEVCVWRARAARSQGELDTAVSSLEQSLARARREAFDDPLLAARVLYEAADIAERRRDLTEAEALYGATVDQAIPGLRKESHLGAKAAALEEVVADGGASRVSLAAMALAGLARVGEESLARDRLDFARTTLALGRPHLEHEVVARATLIIELSAARRAEPGAASRALEAARVLAEPAAVALALFFSAAEGGELREGRGRALSPEALDTLAEAADEVRQAAFGAVRTFIETAVGVLHLEAGADPVRTELLLRHASDALEGLGAPEGASSLDLFLPRDGRFALEVAVRTLVDRGERDLARRLCAAGRRYAQRSPALMPHGSTADQVRRRHRQRFETRWVFRGTPPSREADWSELVEESTPATWPASVVKPGELRLEYRLFDDWMVAFAVGSNLLEMRFSAKSAADIAALVSEVRSVASAELSREAMDAARMLYDLLVAPFEVHLREAERLTIVPDGPLLGLPFSLLRRHAWLGERFGLATARLAPPPTFSAERPLGPSRIQIVGDSASARDLRISMLATEGYYDDVDVCHGDELLPEVLPERLSNARVVHLVGAVKAGPAVALSDGLEPTPVSALASALGLGGVLCTTLMGPASGHLGRQAVAGLLAGCRGGLLVRHWDAPDSGDVLLRYLAEIADATDERGLYDALWTARREAITAGAPVSEWGSFELYIPD